LQTRIDADRLRLAIEEKYADVAAHPEGSFHFHSGPRLLAMLGYPGVWTEHIPEDNLASFAGVGNPFIFGALNAGERVLDLGSGAGVDSLVAAGMVGPTGQVVGVDMTAAMVAKARGAAAAAGAAHVAFREGAADALPVGDAWADVVISNGVINLCPDKPAVWREIFRVLKPGGRIQIADIVVGKSVPEEAKEDVALWTG
jgi:SAM-dependent methyltransferase